MLLRAPNTENSGNLDGNSPKVTVLRAVGVIIHIEIHCLGIRDGARRRPHNNCWPQALYFRNHPSRLPFNMDYLRGLGWCISWGGTGEKVHNNLCLACSAFWITRNNFWVARNDFWKAHNSFWIAHNNLCALSRYFRKPPLFARSQFLSGYNSACTVTQALIRTLLESPPLSAFQRCPSGHLGHRTCGVAPT